MVGGCPCATAHAASAMMRVSTLLARRSPSAAAMGWAAEV